MAKMHSRRQIKKGRYRTLPIGRLTQCSGNGAGGSERLSAVNRMFLEFEAVDKDGVKIVTTVTLDRDEAIEIMRRCFAARRPADPINDVAQLVPNCGA